MIARSTFELVSVNGYLKSLKLTKIQKSEAQIKLIICKTKRLRYFYLTRISPREADIHKMLIQMSGDVERNPGPRKTQLTGPLRRDDPEDHQRPETQEETHKNELIVVTINCRGLNDTCKLGLLLNQAHKTEREINRRREGDGDLIIEGDFNTPLNSNEVKNREFNNQDNKHHANHLQHIMTRLEVEDIWNTKSKYT